MRLGQVVTKRVAVVKLGVSSGSSDGGGYFGIKVTLWSDTAKLTNMVIAGFGDNNTIQDAILTCARKPT